MSRCPLCEKLYADGRPEYFGSDPKCAFETSVFDKLNWQCGTMNALRDITVEYGVDKLWANDSTACLLFTGAEEWYVWDDDNDGPIYEFLLLAWYKERGCTSSAWLIGESETPIPLTLEYAEEIIALYKARAVKDGNNG